MLSTIVKLILLITILGGLALAALGLVVALYRHKNKSSKEQLLLGQIARVVTPLTPDGAVIVEGELWPARSANRDSIVTDTVVQVVGSEDHLLLVKLHDVQ